MDRLFCIFSKSVNSFRKSRPYPRANFQKLHACKSSAQLKHSGYDFSWQVEISWGVKKWEISSRKLISRNSSILRHTLNLISPAWFLMILDSPYVSLGGQITWNPDLKIQNLMKNLKLLNTKSLSQSIKPDILCIISDASTLRWYFIRREFFQNGKFEVLNINNLQRRGFALCK